MSLWRELPFDEVMADESAGNLKTAQSDFLMSGRYPIVDQGKELIGGFSDDAQHVCRSELPVIVFGDHTRCFKYVDFHFCIGADGVKVLRPRIEADVKYLYYYLCHIRIPQAGYDRHFKYLKRCSILLPPLAEQRRITEILDKADALRVKRRVALAQLDTLTQSIFLDMFGDPGTNPKGWPSRPMRDLFFAGPIFGTMIPPGVHGGEWLSLRVGNIQNWQLDLSDQKFVDLPASVVDRHSVQDGDVLLARAIASQGHLGKAVVVHPGVRKWAFDSHLMRLRFNRDKAEPEFIQSLLKSAGGRRLFLKVARRSAVQFNINTREISGLTIPVPPLSLQRAFAERVESLQRVTTSELSSLSELDALFASLQHRAFRGEL